MNDARFERIRAILSRALELPEEEGAAYLDAACADDPSLRPEIDRILNADQKRVRALRTGRLRDWMGGLPGGDVPDPAEHPRSVGPFRILHLLGEGGMGAVFLAEQENPIRRRVALKLIKLGMDTREVIARFEAERQALALMDHPHVAKVFDAGVSEEGRPYFVMEYVPGAPITEFCDQERLSIEERLALFKEVCQALHHAHQKGIIHRDVKPSNILVSRQDGRPAPKVIDFGVAKAVNQRLAERTMMTERGLVVGTPEYMSPEQAESTGLQVDTTTDVYSLGVLLYEILTGVLPLDREVMRQGGWDAIQRSIREKEPRRPSERVSGLGEDAAAVAANRSTTASGLRRRLRGDLDWIVLRALEKDRSRRYPSASELAADVERYLRSEVVTAGPPSTLYRMRKFAWRHRAALAAALVIVASLSFALMESNRQRAKAERARDQSEAVTQFLAETLGAADPRYQGRSTPVGDVLDRAAEGIEGKFDGQPLVEAELRTAIGKAYGGLGDFRSARVHLEAAVGIWRRETGIRNRKAYAAVNALGILSMKQGRYAEAESLLGGLLETERRSLGDDDPDLLDTMSNLATVFAGTGRREEAAALLREAAERELRTVGEESRETLGSLHNLALLYQESGRYAEAESLHVRVLAAQRRMLGPEHPEILTTQNSLAVLYVAVKRYPQAESLLTQIVGIRRRTLGPEHQETLNAMNNLASVEFDLGRFAKAARLHAAVLEVRRRVLGDEHPQTLISMGNLGDAYTWAGEPARGEPLLRSAVSIAARVLGEEHAIHSVTLRKYGVCLAHLGRHREAEAALLRAHALLLKRFGPDHERTRLAERDLADLYEAWGKAAEAAKWRREQVARAVE
jgi:serine/threonine protein kinase